MQTRHELNGHLNFVDTIAIEKEERKENIRKIENKWRSAIVIIFHLLLIEWRWADNWNRLDFGSGGGEVSKKMFFFLN